MKRIIAGPVVVFSLLCLSLLLPGGWGCGAGAAGGGDGDDATTAQEEYTAATASLNTGDIASARDQYDAAAVAAQAAIDDLSGLSTVGLMKAQTLEELVNLLSESQFGGALTRQMLLIDSTPAQAFQANLDFHNSAGSAVLTLSDLLGSGAFLDQYTAHERDAVANPKADLTGMPFTGSFLTSSNHVGRILAFTPDGTTTSEVQDLIEDLQPLIEEIADLLEEASGNADFTFTVPKELYFGDEDIEVSRTDLLYYLAATDLNRASLSLVNTWSFDIDLGSLYSTDGTLVIDKQDLVDTMNDNFFAIRSTTELMEAQTFLAHGFQSLLSALEATPSTDGFGNIEKDATTADLFDQFEQIVDAANDSLAAAAIIPTTAPSITVDLSHLFTNPPSADSIGIDPFVLEGSKIRPVEAFFNGMMEDVVFGMTLPVDTFTILNTTLSGRAARDAIFNEFVSFPPFK